MLQYVRITLIISIFTDTSLRAKVDLLLENQLVMMRLLRSITLKEGSRFSVDEIEELVERKAKTPEELAKFDDKINKDKPLRLQLVSCDIVTVIWQGRTSSSVSSVI